MLRSWSAGGVRGEEETAQQGWKRRPQVTSVVELPKRGGPCLNSGEAISSAALSGSGHVGVGVSPEATVLRG